METVILTILMILLVPLGLVLIGIILLQESKSGGLSGAFGGSGESILGARAGRELSRWTMWGTTVFVVVLITVGILCNHRQRTSLTSEAAAAVLKAEAAKKEKEEAAKGAASATPVLPETKPVEGAAATTTPAPAVETKPAEGAAAVATPPPAAEAKPAEGAAATTTPAPAPSPQPTDIQGGEKK